MKTALGYLIVAGLAILLIQGCGPSEEELREQERARQQAVQDSLQLVYEAQMEQMRQDSIEQARLDSIAAAEAKRTFEYSDTGRFAVQIESWRSEAKAQAQANRWKERGFENTFVVKYGDEDSGDVWYRVRIGRFDTREMAENMTSALREDYGQDSWISVI
jgi:septal ring-binding cell division protein DamX